MSQDDFETYVEAPLTHLPSELEHVLEPWQIKILESRLQEIVEAVEFNCT